ncbi:dimethylaniline monooxygenase [Platysternon megacephalum]|uniref:Dimethylaniline monooxygenase n=1 Tax=Platysternon megacephalum TaxID=55544 RepID=A0A4D9DTX1_9SAUR|nr:dimethylaniline monooxygenase [Platysternon megacephalum]
MKNAIYHMDITTRCAILWSGYSYSTVRAATSFLCKDLISNPKLYGLENENCQVCSEGKGECFDLVLFVQRLKKIQIIFKLDGDKNNRKKTHLKSGQWFF